VGRLAYTHKTTLIDVRLAPTSGAKADIFKPPLHARTGQPPRWVLRQSEWVWVGLLADCDFTSVLIGPQ
jgi:hypothetical protein